MNRNAIYLECGDAYLNINELNQMVETLAPFGIEVVSGSAEREPRAFLSDILIVFSELLSEEILTDAIKAVAYDAIKAVVVIAARKIKSKLTILQGKRERKAEACVQLQQGKVKISIFFPSDLNEEEQAIYFDKSIQALRTESVIFDYQLRNSMYFVEPDEESGEPQVLSSSQYAKKRADRQSKNVMK